jgi:hypothetical protein
VTAQQRNYRPGTSIRRFTDLTPDRPGTSIGRFTDLTPERGLDGQRRRAALTVDVGSAPLTVTSAVGP